MVRSLFLTLLLATPALATTPKFQEGGFRISFEYGPGFWLMDRNFIASQAGPAVADAFTSDLTNGHTLTLGLGYNIKGHATVGLELTGTGWRLTEVTRGGAGFLVGTAAWHPLQLLWMNKEERPLPIDASFFFGFGYGIGGQRIGTDGFNAEVGGRFEYWLTRYFGLGFVLRGVIFKYGALYLDFNNRTAPGNTIVMPQGVGGGFFTFNLALLLRFGE